MGHRGETQNTGGRDVECLVRLRAGSRSREWRAGFKDGSDPRRGGKNKAVAGAYPNALQALSLRGGCQEGRGEERATRPPNPSGVGLYHSASPVVWRRLTAPGRVSPGKAGREVRGRVWEGSGWAREVGAGVARPGTGPLAERSARGRAPAAGPGPSVCAAAPPPRSPPGTSRRRGGAEPGARGGARGAAAEQPSLPWSAGPRAVRGGSCRCRRGAAGPGPRLVRAPRRLGRSRRRLPAARFLQEEKVVPCP